MENIHGRAGPCLRHPRIRFYPALLGTRHQLSAWHRKLHQPVSSRATRWQICRRQVGRRFWRRRFHVRADGATKASVLLGKQRKQSACRRRCSQSNQQPHPCTNGNTSMGIDLVERGIHRDTPRLRHQKQRQAAFLLGKQPTRPARHRFECQIVCGSESRQEPSRHSVERRLRRGRAHLRHQTRRRCLIVLGEQCERSIGYGKYHDHSCIFSCCCINELHRGIRIQYNGIFFAVDRSNVQCDAHMRRAGCEAYVLLGIECRWSARHRKIHIVFHAPKSENSSYDHRAAPQAERWAIFNVCFVEIQ